MSHITRLTSFLAVALIVISGWPAQAGEQGGRRRQAPAQPVPIVRGHVFIGGYFYDPFFGPYPWWPRTQYPWYLPVYDTQAYLKVDLEPDDAAVYIDGYYAGIVDDFDSFFESLPLTPGGHTIVVQLNGISRSTVSAGSAPTRTDSCSSCRSASTRSRSPRSDTAASRVTSK